MVSCAWVYSAGALKSPGPLHSFQVTTLPLGVSSLGNSRTPFFGLFWEFSHPPLLPFLSSFGEEGG